MSSEQDEIERLVAEVRRGKKYRHVSEDLIHQIGLAELEKRSSFKEAIKATRNKLHQVGALYFERSMDYARAIQTLIDARAEGEDALRRQAEDLMRSHTSTRERLGILPEFYSQLMAAVPETKVILDVACGLNPLALPWMNVADGAHYHAFDIYFDLIEFVSRVMEIYGTAGSAQVQNVIHDPPAIEADLALVLKSFPCLEQVEKGAGRKLLQDLQARFIAVSYPLQGVGGRGKGMWANYQDQFDSAVRGLNWPIRRLEFETELVFLIEKG